MDRFGKWKEELKTGGRDRAYSGDRLRSVAMPLGGIGAGTIALAGDGSLRQWQIFNIANHLAMIPDSFFAIWAKEGNGKPVAKALQSSALYDDDFGPIPSVSDYIVPEQAKKLLSRLPGVAATEYVGEYPIAEITYKDDDLPVRVSLEAFCPFIPLNSKDSGLPVIIFTFKVRNSSTEHVQTSIAASLQNAVGYDGIGKVEGIEFSAYGGNRNEVKQSDGLTVVAMDNVNLSQKDPTNGTMVLAALADKVTYLACWSDLQSFWKEFAENGRLPDVQFSEPSEKGKTHNGALAVPVELAPGEEKKITFIYSWHFPNHYVNWNQKSFGIKDEKSLLWIGNAYGAWFGNASEVLDYVVTNFNRLAGETHLFRKTFYDSTLPYWFLDCVSSQISTIRSPTCLWNEDGEFHAFEGCMGASTEEDSIVGGCCPLNCTHVWNYEMTLSRLFPDLERTMRETDLITQLFDNGEVVHRTVLPKYLPRWKNRPVADGQCGTILKTYREYLQSGDIEFLSKLWPRVKRALAFAMISWDEDADGVMDGAQYNTYDSYVHGHNSFITSLYLAALRAAEEMAEIMGEPELAKRYHDRYEKGRVNIDSETFNGEYYIQIYDEKNHQKDQYGTGCLSDQIVGQWWANILDIDHILPADHIKSTLKSIYKYNFRHDFVGFKHQRIYASPNDMGILNCTWPKGGRPEKQAIPYADEIWTGIEYEVAGLMLQEGMIQEALQIVKAARDRYNGSERNPWNEVECGDHYVRPMSSWALIESAAGWRYNAAQATIAVAPRLSEENFRSFFVASHGWGTYCQLICDENQAQTLYVAWGELMLRALRFDWQDKVPEPSSVVAEAGGEPVDLIWMYEDGQVIVEFPTAVTISAGQSLVVRVAE